MVPVGRNRPGRRLSRRHARGDSPPGATAAAVFADWLIRPENPWFARNIVNRVWAWLMGGGIVHEPDDIRPGQSARQSRNCSRSWSGSWSPAITI